METSQSVPELIEAARANAKTAESRIAEIRQESGSDAQDDALRASCVALELLAVDTFSMFEARMQHHFKRGPFSRKLKARLTEEGHAELADRFHQYYLVVNVLKHGTGASYRELRDMPNPLHPVKPAGNTAAERGDVPSELIDVGVSGFFEGLATTLVEAHQFLVGR